MGLHSTDATGVEAMEAADHACEAIQVGLHAIEYVASIALKVRVSLELASHVKALSPLFFDSDTKAQFRTLPLGYDESFGGKLEEPSKQVEE